jgi:hypothetical protein
VTLILPPPPPPEPSPPEPFQVMFNNRGIEVSGRLKTEQDADKLIGALTALKKLLRLSPDEILRLRYRRGQAADST